MANMTQHQIEELIDSFKLNENQKIAATVRGHDVVLTAGAGSGKTLTLVARYTSLLAEGIPPRRIAAITFSKKAAREMRSRVHSKVMALQQTTEIEEERQKWVNLSAEMDSARIGTIHSLCAEILRYHPAEAGIDPQFEVIDEGLTISLRQQAVEDTLKILVEQEKFIPLLYNVNTTDLEEMLFNSLKKRLEANDAFSSQVDPKASLKQELHKRINDPQIKNIIEDLQNLSEEELVLDAGEKLAEMVGDLLELWTQAEADLENNDLVAWARNLYDARRDNMGGRVGKRDSSVKNMISELREQFDELINPITGGKNNSDPIPEIAPEILHRDLLPLFKEAFIAVKEKYADLLDERQALDFDDLEFKAMDLLKQEEIREHWQNEIDALLVDEFQDTNHRQQEIIEALAGKPGSLFVVGDMRQSIYHFRQADVTVFRDVQEKVKKNGGQIIDLNLTYRAHEPLLTTMGDLLSRVIGTEEDIRRDYYVPYTDMTANEKQAPENASPPHVEFIFGVGKSSDDARPVAARALIRRLIELKQAGEIKSWDEVAFLFRATSAYGDYEEALEEYGVPFVTVSGKGFYDRAEIRDLLNILHALADPQDDLAVAGLLRSPAFGLHDAALFLMKKKDKSYWDVLQEDLSYLDKIDQIKAQRSRQIIENLLPIVDRIPVSELIKNVIDTLNYRAILATADLRQSEKDPVTTGGRLYRNLDKLLDDALASQQISLRNFLDMVETLNEAGAREGEAPAEAEGAIRLMTIHKAKGLEFKFVVLAGASRGVRSTSESAYFSRNLGVTLKLDPPPLIYNLAKHIDKDQDKMEELRVLYVALTRAKQKLFISGFGKPKKEWGLSFTNWSNDLVEAAELDVPYYPTNDGEPFDHKLPGGSSLRVWLVDDEMLLPKAIDQVKEQFIPQDLSLTPLYTPIIDEKVEGKSEGEDREIPPEAWQVTRQSDEVQGNILGSMVHKALEHWIFPDNPNIASFLRSVALDAGIASEKQRESTIERTVELLKRLKDHPVWKKIDRAIERHHELPCSYEIDGLIENRVIDLFYRDETGWHIIDFKTDRIGSPARKVELINHYLPQVKQYKRAVMRLVDIETDTQICFLDDQDKVSMIEV